MSNSEKSMDSAMSGPPYSAQFDWLWDLNRRSTHKIRNQLAAIMGNATLLQRMLGENGRRTPLFDEIARAAANASVTLDGLRRYGSSAPASAEIIDFRDVVQDAVSFLDGSLQAIPGLKAQYPDMAVWVNIDPASAGRLICSILLAAQEALTWKAAESLIATPLEITLLGGDSNSAVGGADSSAQKGGEPKMPYGLSPGADENYSSLQCAAAAEEPAVYENARYSEPCKGGQASCAMLRIQCANQPQSPGNQESNSEQGDVSERLNASSSWRLAYHLALHLDCPIELKCAPGQPELVLRIPLWRPDANS